MFEIFIGGGGDYVENRRRSTSSHNGAATYACRSGAIFSASDTVVRRITNQAEEDLILTERQQHNKEDWRDKERYMPGFVCGEEASVASRVVVTVDMTTVILLYRLYVLRLKLN